VSDHPARRHFALDIPDRVLEAIDSELLSYWTGDGEVGLVEAHLRNNYAYFGAVDKSLTGFVVLDDEGDNFTMLDLRGDGRVWWQDHETRDVVLWLDSFDDWLAFRAEVEAAQADDNDDRSEWAIREEFQPATGEPETGSAPTSAELVERWQWLVWFLAQPMTNDGRIIQGSEDLASRGAGGFHGTWPDEDARRETFERELPLLHADPHLAVYWLVHTGLLALDAERGRVLDALAEAAQPELVTAFAEVFGAMELTSDLPVVPDFRMRRSLLIQAASGDEADRARATLRAMAVAPAYRQVAAASWIAHGLEHDALLDAEVAAALDDIEPTVGTDSVRALLDLRAGAEHSPHAERALRAVVESDEGWNETVWVIDRLHRLAADPEVLAAAAAHLLATDGYVRLGLDVAERALQAGANGPIGEAELLRRRPIAEATADLLMPLQEHPETTADVLAGVVDPEIAQVLAQRLLARAEFHPLTPEAIGWAVHSTLAGVHPDRTELAGRGLRALPLDALKEAVTAIGGDIERVEDPVVPVLLWLLERLPAADDSDYLTEINTEAVITAVYKALFPVAHTSTVFDRLLAMAEAPAESAVVSKLWDELFNPFSDETYLLPRLSGAQAVRACEAMIATMLEHPNIHARGSAGHQLYRFDHKGAAEFLITAIDEYGARYAASDPEHTRELDHGRTEDHQLEEVVADLYAALLHTGTPETKRAVVERLFTERRAIWRMGNAVGDCFSAELHRDIMVLLAERRDHRAAAHYAYALDEHADKHWPKVKLAAEVADWPLPEDATERALFKYALIIGAAAALAAKEFALVRAAHALLSRIEQDPVMPDSLVRDRSWTNPLDDDALRAELAGVLSGDADAARQRLFDAGAAARAGAKPKKRISDADLGVLSGSTVVRRIVDDKATGEVWFVDADGALHRFDGYGMAEPPCRVAPVGFKDMAAFLKGATGIAERALMWNRKRTELAELVRWDERLTCYWGPNNGTLERLGLVFDDQADAARAFELVKQRQTALKYTESEPWYLDGAAAVVRSYYTPDAETHMLRAFDSARFAVDPALAAEAEREELELLRDRDGVLSCVETTSWNGYRKAADMTVAEWASARARNDEQDAVWHATALTDIAERLETQRFGAHEALKALRVEVGDGAADADIAAFEAARTHAVPEALRDLWRRVGSASWSVAGSGLRLLSPAESLERRPRAREAGQSFLDRMSHAEADAQRATFEALDVLIETEAGEPLVVISDTEENVGSDGRVYTSLDVRPNDLWWSDSLSWMIAVGFTRPLTAAIAEAAVETSVLYCGQPFGPGLARRRFEAEGKGGMKFWELWHDPAADVIATRNGKVGTKGTLTTKRLGDPAKALKEAAKLIAAKARQGYREVTA
jgi:predicted DNA-binding WGR domain protein